MARTICLLWTVALTIVSSCYGYALVSLGDEYWTQRASILLEEEARMIGGDLVFEEKERLANQILMKAKQKEIDDGSSAFILPFSPDTHLPDTLYTVHIAHYALRTRNHGTPRPRLR
jgi:hypothetical protein